MPGNDPSAGPRHTTRSDRGNRSEANQLDAPLGPPDDAIATDGAGLRRSGDRVPARGAGRAALEAREEEVVGGPPETYFTPDGDLPAVRRFKASAMAFSAKGFRSA